MTVQVLVRLGGIQGLLLRSWVRASMARRWRGASASTSTTGPASGSDHDPASRVPSAAADDYAAADVWVLRCHGNELVNFGAYTGPKIATRQCPGAPLRSG